MADPNMDASETMSYAKAAGTTFSGKNQGKPIFLKHRDIPNVKDKEVDNQEMYKALLKSVSSAKIMGIQRIGGLWRLYITEQSARIGLITNGMTIRDACISVYDTNPFLPGGNENLLKLTIKDVPLFADNSVITDELERMKYKVVGKVSLQKLRVDGQLTNCLTGDRVIFIERPKQPVPRLVVFGIFRGKVFHANQISKDQTSVVCSNCLNKGHHRSKCTNQVVCRFCKQVGHYQRECTMSTQVHQVPSEKPSGPPTNTARSPAARQNDSTSGDHDQGITTTTRLTADRREIPGSRSHTPVTQMDKENASASTHQCKITQFIHQEREANSNARTRDVDSGATGADSDTNKQNTPTLSEAESDGNETDAWQESDASIESPEIPKAGCLTRSAKNKKRKQKAEKKPKKK